MKVTTRMLRVFIGKITISAISKALDNVRSFSSYRNFQEVSLKVPWGFVAGKWWEPYDVRPILCLHGWQDNCATFDRLVPLLDRNIGFLTVDFPGHGYSSQIPLGTYYHISYYLLTIRAIHNYFKWPKISLMGHSLGAVTSYMYTMLYNKSVDFTICLDASKPVNRHKGMGQPFYMANAFDDFLKYNSFVEANQEPPSYDIETIYRMIADALNGSVAIEYSPVMAARNVAPSKLHPGKYYFTRDPRLKAEEVMNFSQDKLLEYAQYMFAPLLILKCKGSSYFEDKENFYKNLDILRKTSNDCDFQYVEGTHHAHLNQPEVMVDHITNFISRNNIEDRSVGVLENDIIVDKNSRKKSI